jgi:ABC-type oligopeptide transport system substrate-binding subunit
MKKIVSLLSALALVMCFTFASCNRNTEATIDTIDTTATVCEDTTMVDTMNAIEMPVEEMNEVSE